MNTEMIDKVLQTFVRAVVCVLMVLVMVMVAFGAVELGILLTRELANEPAWVLDVGEFRELFGFFLMVLIGLELLETIRGYLGDSRVHAEVVLLVAVIALAQKLVVADFSEKPMALFGYAAAILAVTAGYYLMRRAVAAPRTPTGAGGKPRRWEGDV